MPFLAYAFVVFAMWGSVGAAIIYADVSPWWFLLPFFASPSVSSGKEK